MATNLGDNNATYVQTKNKDYERFEERWELVRSVVASEVTKYLRNVGANEATDEAAKQRQKAYVDGAIFYNFTKRTIDGMVGSIFRKDPEIELPTELEYLLTDIDGNGQGIIQQSQEAVKEDLMLGRLGLFVDVPPPMVDIDGNEIEVTLQDQRDGKVNPKVQIYTAESIINWRTARIGSVNKLVMIVLAEEYEYQSGENEFLYLTGTQYRVLDFDENGYYRQRIWRYNDKGELVNSNGQTDFSGTSIQVFEPLANGERMTEIPFVFIGSENNDYTVDESPIYPLAETNIGHYRNVADNEEQLFVAAQAMLVIAPEKSIANKWNEHNPNGVRFGARGGLNVGEGGNAFLLQASSTNALSEAIAQKEDQAVKIGAQLITPTQQVTAEAARIQRGADTSVLASIANNVTSGYQKAIQWCLDFLGSDSEFDFSLNTEFFMQTLTAQDRQAWAADVNMGLLPVSEYRRAMRKAGQIEMTDEEIIDELELEGLDNEGIPPGPTDTEMMQDQQEAPPEE